MFAKHLRFSLAGFLVFASFAFGQKKPVTLSDFLDQKRPAPIQATWRPDGLAFVYTESGKVILYDVKSRQARPWFVLADVEKFAKKSPVGRVPFSWQNRRVSSEAMQWFPDNKRMLVQAEGDLFVIAPDGKADQLTSTEFPEEDAKLSPDGKTVLYRSNGNLFLLNVESRKVKALVSDSTATVRNGELDWVYPEELDLGTAMWWSPDSKYIAYMRFDVSNEKLYPHADLLDRPAIAESQRYPQAGTPNATVKIGVVPAKGGKRHWMEVGSAGESLYPRIGWLPDSSKLSVERLTRVQDQLDLLLCDPKSGKAETIIHEQAKPWINVNSGPRFLKSRPEFIWPSEEPTGFRHLFRYSLDGKKLAQLTQGEWQVDDIEAIDEKAGNVYYTSRQESPLEEQFYRVSLEGGAPQRLTKQEGTHRIQANENGTYYLSAASSVTTPPGTSLHESSGAEIAVLRSPERQLLDQFDILPSKTLEVQSEGGTKMYGRLIKPANFQPQTKYPLIVIVYGGPGAQSIVNAWSGLSLEQVLAHQGFVVWQLDNRGSHNRGRNFEAPIYHELGRTELIDQCAGVKKLVNMGFVDRERVGIFGWSYGGFMTIYSLLHAPDVFKAGVAGAPVNDFRNYDTIYTERYMGLPTQNKDGYDRSSNILSAAKLQAPLLILHNFEDDNVLFQNTMQMANALEQAGKTYSMMLYPQKTHGVTGPIRKSMYTALIDFFNQHLKK